MTKKKAVPEDKKKAVKFVEVELTETMVKYDFSQDELVGIGEQVADFSQKLATLEAEGKQIARQYKADIEGVELQQGKLIRFIRDKFEMKRMECFKVIDGLAKKVYFYRCDQVVDLEIFRAQGIEDLRSGYCHPQPAKERDARPSELQRELPGLTVKTSETVEGAEQVETE